jgi:integrase
MMTLHRGWYWKINAHKYKRASVEDIEQFCGWNFLIQLVKECENTKYRLSPAWAAYNVSEEQYKQSLITRDQALIATLFLTGGRATEVLRLRKKQFTLTEQWIRVQGMVASV